MDLFFHKINRAAITHLCNRSDISMSDQNWILRVICLVPISSRGILNLSRKVLMEVGNYSSKNSVKHVPAMFSKIGLIAATGKRGAYMINPDVINCVDTKYLGFLNNEWDKFSVVQIMVNDCDYEAIDYSEKAARARDIERNKLKSNFNKIESYQKKYNEVNVLKSKNIDDRKIFKARIKDIEMDVSEMKRELSNQIKKNHEEVLFLLSKFAPEKREEVKAQLRLVVDNETVVAG